MSEKTETPPFESSTNVADHSANSVNRESLEDENNRQKLDIEKLKKINQDQNENHKKKEGALKDEISRLKKIYTRTSQVTCKTTQTPPVDEVENMKKIKNLEIQLNDVMQSHAQEKKILEEKIIMLMKRNQDLEERLSKLEDKKECCDLLEDELRLLKKEFREMKEKQKKRKKEQKEDHNDLQSLITDRDLLRVRQLFTLLNVNICMYVLEEEFSRKKETQGFNDIETFINNKIEKIEDSTKKDRANARLLKLKRSIDIEKARTNYNNLSWLKKEGNIVAHCDLDEEIINRSIENLQKTGKLDGEYYKQVKELATMLKTLKSM